jgi:Ca-activated chloride channel family protein
MPQEEIDLTFRYGQLLQYDGDRIRLTLPTVIAPYYGNPETQGQLEPHQIPETDLLAKYPFTLQLDILGSDAQGEITSPSHLIKLEAIENGQRVILNSESFLDSEFVLSVSNLKNLSYAVISGDDQETVVTAGFAPAFPLPQKCPLAVKVLFDCSGSMLGSSLKLGKKTLMDFLDRLGPDDYLSLSVFGSKVTHLTSQMLRLTKSNMTKIKSLVRHLQADMGGTEMNQALSKVIKDLDQPPEITTPPQILLLTDGEVWDIDRTIKTGTLSEKRIFAVGLGCAPGAEIISNLGAQTLGAAEFLTPNEDTQKAAERLIRKMAAPVATEVSVLWDQKPLWETQIPSCLYPGVTVYAMAGFAEKPLEPPTLSFRILDNKFQTKIHAFEDNHLPELIRLAGARRLTASLTPAEKEALALKYQLLSSQTSMIVVHERHLDKAEELPQLHKVKQMVPQGQFDDIPLFNLNRMARSLARERVRQIAPSKSCILPDLPGFGSTNIRELFQIDYEPTRPQRLTSELLNDFNAAAEKGPFSDFVADLKNSRFWQFMADLIKAKANDLPENAIIAYVLECLAETYLRQVKLSRQAQRLIRNQVKDITEGQKKSLKGSFERAMGMVKELAPFRD